MAVRRCPAWHGRSRGFEMPPVGKIAQLPPELRQWLHEALVERAFGDIRGVTEELQERLREAGVAVYIGKSAVGAESQKVKRAQEAIRATTEAARLIAESSKDSADHRSEGAMALVQSEVFELMLEIREAEEQIDPVAKMKLLANVAKSVAMMSRARVNQAKWSEEVNAKALAAADKVGKLARAGGLDKKTVDEIRSSILGISKREAAQ